MGESWGRGVQRREMQDKLEKLETSHSLLQSTKSGFSLLVEIQDNRPKHSCSMNPYFMYHFVQNYLEQSPADLVADTRSLFCRGKKNFRKPWMAPGKFLPLSNREAEVKTFSHLVCPTVKPRGTERLKGKRGEEPRLGGAQTLSARESPGDLVARLSRVGPESRSWPLQDCPTPVTVV